VQLELFQGSLQVALTKCLGALLTPEVGMAPECRHRWMMVRMKRGNSIPTLRARPRRAGLHAWPTPTARDWKNGKSNLHGKNARPLSEVALLYHVGTGRPGALNPAHSRWLMGYPVEWDLRSPGYAEWLAATASVGSEATATP
jgi:hypothetical protein